MYDLYNNSKMVRIYSCEGNIGAGKTTLLGYIEDMCKESGKKNIVILREPVDIWATIKDKTGDNILENFYKNPEKYAFPFQVLAFTTRLNLLKQTIKENPSCEIVICERSLYADGNIFAKMLFDDKTMDYLSYQIYKKMYENAIEEYPLSGVIYLSIPPELCLNRIAQRGRSGEENIPIEYLEKCHKYHDLWLNQPELDYNVIQMNREDVDNLIKNKTLDNFLDSLQKGLKYIDL